MGTTIMFFLPHSCQFIETLLSSSLNFFISTPPLGLSDQLQNLSLIMFLGLEILGQGDMISEPSGVLLPLSGMPCLSLEASGMEVIPLSCDSVLLNFCADSFLQL